MKLITWNIQWGRGVDGRVDLTRIVGDAQSFADFDVLCLQEVSCGYPELAGSDGSDQFTQLARLLPDFHAVAGIATDVPRLGGGRSAFGNMLLSRYPVLQVFRHLLPWPAQDDVQSMQRMALEATLDTPLGLLRVTTTHLEYFAPAQRRAQVERLRELQRDAVGQARSVPIGEPSSGPFYRPSRGGPAILTGDFNFLPEVEEYGRLTSAIDAATPAYRDAWRLQHPGVPHAPTVGLYDKAQWPGDPFTFDFVFVSEDLAPHVQGIDVNSDSRASDHQPVLLELA